LVPPLTLPLRESGDADRPLSESPGLPASGKTTEPHVSEISYTTPALHPLFLDAKRLLNALPIIDSLDIRGDEVRIVAALYAQRRCAEEAAERLIALLDELDPDPDLEPSLGVDPTNPSVAAVDCEADPSDEEPSLGWTSSINQLAKHRSGKPAGLWGVPVEDGEQEHDGREPQGDEEPSLGSIEQHFGMWEDRSSQLTWGCSSTTDREPDGDEGDHDEAAGGLV
jgi:hypothetical protein